MAEARSAVSELRIATLDEGRNSWKDFATAWRRSFVKGFFRTRNLIRNGMWPTSIYNLGMGVAIFSTSLVGDWRVVQPVNRKLWQLADILRIRKDLPYHLQIFLISSSGGVVFFVILMYSRQWLLRLLLAYRGWMYESPHKQSWWTTVWGIIVWMASGYHPTTFSYQKSLPQLPVPPLHVSVNKFLASVEPLCGGADSDQFKILTKEAQDFQKDVGPKLQRLLILKSWWSPNWVTDWWEKYIYLMSRSPIAINSNYYCLDHSAWCPTDKQISRVASTIYQFMVCKRMIDHERLSPILLRNTIPLCMAQYERIYSTTRIPGVEIDELVKFDSSVSKHVVIMREGVYYRLDVFDSKNQPLTPQQLEKQVQWIMEDAEKHKDEYSEMSRSLAALTGIDRTEWANLRIKYFASGINKESLDVLESAIFHVVLENKSYPTWTERGKHALHGDGKSIWFDKSFNLISFSNGRLGLNVEHSWGDAPVIGHISEYILTEEAVTGLYDENGFAKPVTSIRQAAVTLPRRLLWDINADLETTIARSIAFNLKNNSDLDLLVVEHKDYGKGFIKTCKVSPDAFVQTALQLAYFKDSKGKLALTYESSMTRLYLQGRTETVRSLSTHLAEFVQSMSDKTKSKAERIELLRKSCNHHQNLYRDAMNGRGFDRHLFGLYVLSKGLGYDSKFLRDALSMPWTLSTSQQPQQQIQTSPDCSDPQYRDKVCPGGGFGPVSDNGYGVSYMFAGDLTFFFHVSSKRSSTETDSQRFVDYLYESLKEMKELFQEKADH